MTFRLGPRSFARTPDSKVSKQSVRGAVSDDTVLVNGSERFRRRQDGYHSLEDDR
jgi:hypothetical protein